MVAVLTGPAVGGLRGLFLRMQEQDAGRYRSGLGDLIRIITKTIFLFFLLCKMIFYNTGAGFYRCLVAMEPKTVIGDPPNNK